MQKALVRRQMPVTNTVTPTASGVSGGATVSSGVDLGSSLLLGASGSPTNTVSGLLTTNNGATSSSTPNTSSSSSSSNPPPSVSTASVIAITVAVFVVLIGAMFLIYTYIKRRTTPPARHPPSRGPQPAVRDHGKDKQRNTSNDRSEGKNNSSLGSLNRSGARARSPDSARFGLFEKDPSLHSLSDEKANMSTSDDHHFDPSAMASFAKYQVGQLDGFSALSHSSPLASHEGGSPPISWDGGTVIGDPLTSLHASVSDTMSPTAVSPTAVVIRQTPLTTDSAQHRWESAEVVMMDEATSEPMSVYSDASQNPFNDDAPRRSTGSRESVRRSSSNPFFNASQHSPFAERSTRSRASSVSTTTAKRSRSYSASSHATVRAAAAAAGGGGGGDPESENALVSLLAALRPTPVVSDEQNNRGSMRTTLTSLYTPAEGGADPETPQAL